MMLCSPRMIVRLKGDGTIVGLFGIIMNSGITFVSL